MQGVDGAAGQAVVLGKQVVQDLGVAVAAISKQGDDAGHELVRGVFRGKERLGDFFDPIVDNGDELVIAECVEHAGHGHAEALGILRNAEHGLVRGQSRKWNGLMITHSSKCSRLPPPPPIAPFIIAFRRTQATVEIGQSVCAWPLSAIALLQRAGLFAGGEHR